METEYAHIENLDEFMRAGIIALVLQAVEQAANICNDEDEAAHIPIAFFRVQQRLLKAWGDEWQQWFELAEQKGPEAAYANP